MIKYYFICLHILLIALVYAVLSKTNCDSFTEKYHNELRAFYFRVDQNLTSNHIVFFGDSHIQGLAVQEVSEKAVNYGMGSDTTDGLLARIHEYPSINRARAIFVLIGFNDLRTKTNEAIIQNLSKILERLPKTTPLILSEILPISQTAFLGPALNKRIHNLNIEINKQFDGLSNVTIFRIEDKLKDDNGQLLKQFHVGDGIHLSSAGYAIFIDQLKETLKSIIIKE